MASGPTRSVLVLGGASELGLATAAALVRAGPTSVVLAGRHAGALAAAAHALREAGAVAAWTATFDAEDTAGHDAAVERAVELAGGIDVAILAFGLLGPARGADAATDEGAVEDALRVARTNYVGAVSAGLSVARRLRRQGHGTLVVLSSAAGQRAGAGNFVYSSTKAGVDAFAQGLGDALAGSGARVLVVRPGFVRGRMTAGRRPKPLATTPEAVAAATTAALAAGRDVVWVPGALRPAFAVLRHLPRPLWRRLTRW